MHAEEAVVEVEVVVEDVVEAAAADIRSATHSSLKARA